MVLAPPDEEGLVDLKQEYERFRERHPDATREDFIAYLRAGALKRQVEERLQPPAVPTPEFRKQQATLEDLQRRAYGTPVSPAAERAKRLREMTEQRLQPEIPERRGLATLGARPPGPAEILTKAAGRLVPRLPPEEQARAAAGVEAAAGVLGVSEKLAGQEYEQMAPERAVEKARVEPQIGLGERLEKGIPGTVAGEVPPLTRVAARYPEAFAPSLPQWAIEAGLAIAPVAVLGPLIGPTGAAWMLGFAAESMAEEKGIIPGKPVTRATSYLREPGSRALQGVGVPKPVADTVSELALWAAASVVAPKVIPTRFLKALGKVSAEDAAATARAIRKGILAPGEVARALTPEGRVPPVSAAGEGMTLTDRLPAPAEVASRGTEIRNQLANPKLKPADKRRLAAELGEVRAQELIHRVTARTDLDPLEQLERLADHADELGQRAMLQRGVKTEGVAIGGRAGRATPLTGQKIDQLAVNAEENTIRQFIEEARIVPRPEAGARLTPRALPERGERPFAEEAGQPITREGAKVPGMPAAPPPVKPPGEGTANALEDAVTGPLGQLEDESAIEAIIRQYYGGMTPGALRTKAEFAVWQRDAAKAGLPSTAERNEVGESFIRALARRQEGAGEKYLAAHPEHRELFNRAAAVLDETEAMKVAHFGARGKEFPLIPNYFPGLYKDVPVLTGRGAGVRGGLGVKQFFQRHRNLYLKTDEAIEGFALEMRPEVRDMLRLELKAEQLAGVPAKGAVSKARDARIALIKDILETGRFPGTEFISYDPMEVALAARMATEQLIQADLLFEKMKAAGLLMLGRAHPTGWRIPRDVPMFQGKMIVAQTRNLSPEQWQVVRGGIEAEIDTLRSLVPDTHIERLRHDRQIKALEDILASEKTVKRAGAEVTVGRLRAPRVVHTPGWAVPDEVATTLERAFETGGGGVSTAMKAFAWFAGLPKRIKVLLSPFQHLDIFSRGTAIEVSAGKPWKAVPMAIETLESIVSPPKRLRLLREWATDPQLKMVAEQVGAPLGGQGIGRRALTNIADDWTRHFPLLGDIPLPPGKAKTAQTLLNNLYSFVSAGLFDGEYMVIGKHVIKTWWAEYAARHPEWTAETIAAAVGKDMHVALSTIPDWMSLTRTPTVRNFFRALLFSANEQEGLLRGAVRIGTGLDKTAWRKYWLSYYVGTFLLGETINRAVTGKWFGPEQLLPVTINPRTKKPQFNWQFLRPVIMFTEDGRPIYADLLMQLDTPLRWIANPIDAFVNRTSVPVQTLLRTMQNQKYDRSPVTTAETYWAQMKDKAFFTMREFLTPISVESITEMKKLGVVPAVLRAFGVNIVPGPYNSPELRRLLEEHGVDPNKGIRGLSELDDVPRAAFLAEHPEVKDLWVKDANERASRGSEFADMALRSAEIGDEDYRQQVAIDTQAWGSSPSDHAYWRGIRSDHRTRMAGRWEQWRKDFGDVIAKLPQDDVEDQTVADFYESVFLAAEIPGTGEVDPTKMNDLWDRWFAAEGTDQVKLKSGRTLSKAEVVNEHLGIRQTKREQQYYRDLPLIVPAWDMEDDLWGLLQDDPKAKAEVGLSAFDLSRFSDARAFTTWLKRVKIDTKIKAGVEPLVAQEQAEEETQKAMTPFYGWRADRMTLWYQTPDGKVALRRQVYWGFEPNVREELESLLGEE
jgi:hypothetical protein